MATRREGTEERPPVAPDDAVPVPAARSGYLQTLTPGHLLRYVAERGITVALVPRFGDYVVAGTPVAYFWSSDGTGALPGSAEVAPVVASAVDLGFERTLQQDVAFGIRQLVDTACKALSPAVNDPYTAVQSVHHLSDILVILSRGALGPQVVHRSTGTLVIPSRAYADYLAAAVGPIRRYGAAEPTVVVALLQLMTLSADAGDPDGRYAQAIRGEAALLLEDAERRTENPADLRTVHAAYARLELALAS